jgi:FOG: Ankyrin repeat
LTVEKGPISNQIEDKTDSKITLKNRDNESPSTKPEDPTPSSQNHEERTKTTTSSSSSPKLTSKKHPEPKTEVKSTITGSRAIFGDSKSSSINHERRNSSVNHAAELKNVENTSKVTDSIENNEDTGKNKKLDNVNTVTDKKLENINPGTDKIIDEVNTESTTAPLSRSNTPNITDPKLLHLFDDDYEQKKPTKSVKQEEDGAKKDDFKLANLKAEPKETSKTSFSDYLKLSKTKPSNPQETSISTNQQVQESEKKEHKVDTLDTNPAIKEAKKEALFVPTSSESDGTRTSNLESEKPESKGLVVELPQKPIENDVEKDLTNKKSKTDQDSEIKKDFSIGKNEENDEEDVSEAETDINDHTPRVVKGRRLVRKKEYDELRHKLKRKAVYSSEEEDEEEENRNNPLNQQSDDQDQSGDERKKTCQRPYKLKRDSGGRSLLQRACKKGTLSDIENYLARGANANEKDFCGFTCLHEAALEGHTKVAKILIEHGANVNAQADEVGDSETPLIDAAENKHIDTVKLLLQNGADPSIYNIDGFTALTKIHNEHAEEEGYEGIIKLLEEASAKNGHRNNHEVVKSKALSTPNVVDDPNDTYFGDLIKKKGIYKYAAEGSKEVTANYFVSGNSLSAKPDILILAARNGHVELVDIILGLNPTPYDIDTENNCGCTALLASVGRGHIEVVESLLSKDADPFKKRKQDNLNVLEIARGSVHFDQKEIDLIEKYMAKKKGSKESKKPSSAISSVATSRIVSRNTSRSVSEAEEMDEEATDNEDFHMEDVSFRKRRNSVTSDNDNPTKKNKKLKSETKPKVLQASSVFKKEQTPEAPERPREDSSLLQPEKKPKSTHTSASPSPAPLSKAQEELKAKNAEEARIWQEKVLAKKRARRDMFLKLEKEKELRRKEEEGKKIEDAKKFAALKEQARIWVSKEAEETSKLIRQQRERLMRQMTIESYPVGLRKLQLVQPLSKECIIRYSPLYIFELEGKKYTTDLQISLLTGRSVSSLHNELDPKALIEATSADKSKIWSLYFFMIGIDGNYKPENAAALHTEGHTLFQNLLLHFVELEKVVPIIKRDFPLTYDLIWGTGSNNRYAEVDLESLHSFEINSNCSVLESDMDVVIDTKSITESNFIPPKLRRRTDILKTIKSTSRPLW